MIDEKRLDEIERSVVGLPDLIECVRLARLGLNARKVLDYCEPHTDQMWADSVVSRLLDCDFRDAKQALESYRKEG